MLRVFVKTGTPPATLAGFFFSGITMRAALAKRVME
jgi:hypothetical protein